MFLARSHSRDCAILDRYGRSESPNRPLSRRTAGRVRQALGLALLLALPGGAQNGHVYSSDPQPSSQHPGGLFAGEGDADPVQEDKRLRALNAERQKSLVSDTNKLLKLARELDDEVNRNDQGSFDQAEMTKAAEIEKLAHKVKEKMSTSVRSTTNPQPFPAFPVR